MDEENEDFNGRLLHQAALWGNAELLEDLLHGDEIHFLDAVDTLGRSALHAAATNDNETCARILLQAGANPNLPCNSKGSGKTPLHVAAESGHSNIALLLLSHGADLLAKDCSGLTALDLAEKSGHLEIMATLRKAADELEEKRQELYLVLWNACSKGDSSQAKQVFKQLGPEAELVINTAPNGCNTLLFKACEDGQKEIVKLLLENGADGRCHPVTRYSPLYIACYYGRKDIVDILLKKFPELVQQATVEKWLPIHAAAINGHINVMNLLLEFSYPPELSQTYTDPTGNLEYVMPFDINSKDVTGQSVLYIACYVGNHRMVELLLKFRVKAKRVSKVTSPAESDKVISEPRTPGAEATSSVRTSPKRKLSESLQNIMSKLNLRSGNGDKEAARNEVVTCPVEVDLYCNNDSETALHVAVKNKHYNIASLLLQNGASPNLKIAATEQDIDKSRDEEFAYSGSTALVEACRNRDATVVDLLIRYGARDDECKALRIAATNKDYHFMSKLLSLKAHQDPEYKINKKSLDIAASGQMTGLGSSVTYSAMFPTTPVMINWHRQRCLQFLREQWLIDASVAHNVKLKLTPKNQGISMTAITRLDISSNELTELLPCIFQMPSLKILNAAQNKLERLPDFEAIKTCPQSPSSPTRTFSNAKTSSAASNAISNPWFCPILEEIHLQENRLETIPSYVFELPSLVILDLSNNKLQSLPVKMWSSPKLRELNVSLNMLHDLPSMPHNQIALPLPMDGSRNLSKDSAEDLQSSVESSPVHSVDVVSVTSCESKSQDGRYSVEGFAQTHLIRQDIHHHNVWSRSVEVVDALPDGSWDKNLQCQLVSLNLAHNAYEKVPPVLACCALGLARLNLSYNKLITMGPVSHYPANLKHLDLSHNRINSWFSVNTESSSDLSNLGVGCYNVTDFTSTKIVRKATSGLRALPRSLTAPGPLHICPHRRHVRLDNLRTLILADNELDRLVLSLDVDDEDDDRSHDSYDTGKDSPICTIRYRSLFTNLSMLDISNNCIREIPTVLSELTNLSVLNLSGNIHLTTLPPEMGLLSKLWNLNTRGCNLNDPLKSMIESKKYKTMDIIGYLKSILEDAKPYARMKLMIVGIQGIGKTSLLEQLRLEGTGSYKKKPPEHWAKRMGNRNINLKTAKGISMSTVGVDVGDWTFEKKVRGQSTHGPVTFRTWDFGGQREYYATHQYFLSKRSLYLVVWRITDGEKGINAIQQWLVNIQARAPNAPVIIVGTHYDLVKDKFPPSYSEELQQLIRERFINIVDADKCGLPRVLDTIEISCKTRHNVKLLCSLMYDCVFGLSCPGSKERLLEQKIPATYLALEDVVGYLALERRLQAKDPVLRAEQYKMLVMHEMQQKFNIAFRDMAELNQATTFLHENGVLLHYEDATLKDLYFLDPQWLCDMLAHVVTIREINPFARNGIMKIEDLKHVFKTSQCAPGDAQMYILNLLNKFEVALTWDNRTLLIPCLLPTEEHLRAGLPGCDVRIPVRSRSWALRKTYATTKQISAPVTSNVSLNLTERKLGPDTSMDRISGPIINDPLEKDVGVESFSIPPYSISHQSTLDKSIFRLLLISYFPSGFWSRLMTRILADDTIVEIIRSFFTFPREVLLDPVLASALNRKAEWICWQTGMELRYLDTTLFRLKEVQPNLGSAPCDYNHMKLLLLQEGNWSDVDIANSSILEILLPNQEVMVQKTGLDSATKKNSSLVVLKPNQACVAKLLALAVDHIDILLEDWYPTLGTRFVHTSEGKFLVTRVVPCMDCLVNHCKSEYSNYPTSSDGSDDMWQLVDVLRGLKGDICYSKELYVNNPVSRNLDAPRLPRNGANSPSLPGGRRQEGSRGSTASHDSDSGVGPDSNGSSRKPSAEGRSDDLMSPNDQDANNSQGSVGCEESIVYSFMVEECILTAYEQKILKCPVHGEQQLTHISPDTIFGDLGERYLIPPDNIKKGKMLGRGAFGFVFKATVKQRGFNTLIEVAMKMLQPVEPGYGARQSDAVAYKAAWNKWQRDPLQYACKAYCTARQELNILLTLRHPNIVPLVGICTRPLALVLRLAPQGALDAVLRNYRRSGARLDVFVLQKVVVQVAKALEYLHQQHIIYRDLKSENVLVWDLPPPFHPTNPQPNVDVKLADYGISRATLPTGTKGFGGTEGFMAPEIMRFNGEEEYTEKVDCFSFGMFMYELVTLHLPFEGQECVKDNILEGGRPSVTNREMIYPTYILDLMTLCWAQQPKDRPSASQIVSIGTAPEFVHLVDVVSLQEHTTVLSATATVLDCDDEDYASQSWEVWLSRLGKQIDILSCGQHSWHEYKVLNVDAAAVTALCVVEDTVWLGDSRGTVHVYSSLPYVEVRAFALDVECSPPLAIRNICYLKASKKIAVTTNNGRLWLCDIHLCKPKDVIEDLDPVNNNQVEDDPMNPLVRELGGNGNPIFCVTAVSFKDSCQLWCGQTQGSISVYKFQGDIVEAQDVVYHYDPIVDNVDVTQLISGNTNGPAVWSYIYPGCVVYLWDVEAQEILQKLDCSKLVPCSESLMSISIEEHLSPGRCQVTAMAVQGSELYIGTTWGCVVVAEGSTMRPITIFRPYEEEVKVILPLARSKHRQLSPEQKDCDFAEETTFPLIATAGKGYRNLIGRYTVLPNGDESPLRSMFLMLWQTEFWFSN